MEDNQTRTSRLVREQIAHINPYTAKVPAMIWAVGFLSSVLAALILADSDNLARFRRAVAAAEKKAPLRKGTMLPKSLDN